MSESYFYLPQHSFRVMERQPHGAPHELFTHLRLDKVTNVRAEFEVGSR
jgi:hypothetical protein